MNLPRVTTRLSAAVAVGLVAAGLTACGAVGRDGDVALRDGRAPPSGQQVVAERISSAIAADGGFISWREHLVDGGRIPGGAEVQGGDGLEVRDLDGDGLDDVVAVFEADVSYGVRNGHVRASFASPDPDRWHNVWLAQGPEAAGAEDLAIGDINGDGFPDVLVACELDHLLYLQNPGGDAARHRPWQRLILPMTIGRGSFIRVAMADLDGDGRPEVIAVNKGVQNPSGDELPTPVSIFTADGDPLVAEFWREREIVRLRVPINAEPVEIDGDGDVDLLVGSRGERALYLYRNVGGDRSGSFGLAAPDAPLSIVDGRRRQDWRGMTDGSHLKFHDMDDDARLDIVVRMFEPRAGGLYYTLGWMQQPDDLAQPWTYHPIGTLYPDVAAGFAVTDIDGDGDLDLITGSYSGLDVVEGGYSGDPRDRDGPNVHVDSSVGRIAWFANPGDPTGRWTRHDISRRVRGMYDEFVARDLDHDGDPDFLSTRGNSGALDGLFWLEQVRTDAPERSFYPAGGPDSRHLPLPTIDAPPPPE